MLGCPTGQIGYVHFGTMFRAYWVPLGTVRGSFKGSVRTLEGIEGLEVEGLGFMGSWGHCV